MKIIKGTNKGFFGNVLDAARHISHAIKESKPWYVDWDNTPYNDPKKGPNAWEYYYINNDHFCLESSDVVSDYTSLELFENLNFRQTMNVLLSRYIKLNRDTESMVNSVLQKTKVKKDTLGIHIRKTDKNNGYLFGEPPSAKPLNASVYIKYIDMILPLYNGAYVASDDAEDFDLITEHITGKHNKPVSCIDAFRSKGDISIHNNYPEISGFKKGLEVLIDCYMLSRCGHLIRSTSNVGSAAQFINLDLTHTNINEIELGDTREKEYNL